MMRWLGSLVTLLVGCSSSGAEPFYGPCTIGELTGTWRVHYTETDGTCGKLADETMVMSAASKTPQTSQCTYAASQVSQDKCRIDMDFTCPLTGIPGTQHWAGLYKQTGDGLLQGTFTAQASSPTAGTCRSTYSITMQRQ